MDRQVDFWTPHLHPDERIVWSASASPQLRNARLMRRRLAYGAAGVGSALIAFLFVIRLLDALDPASGAPLLIAAVVPLYLVFALAMAALSLWGFRKAAAPLHPGVHFAATPTRLISLDSSGSLVDELAAADMAGVLAGGSSRSPDLYVLRLDDTRADHPFYIEHIERPLEAKAILEQTFPQSVPESAAP